MFRVADPGHFDPGPDLGPDNPDFVCDPNQDPTLALVSIRSKYCDLFRQVTDHN